MKQISMDKEYTTKSGDWVKLYHHERGRIMGAHRDDNGLHVRWWFADTGGCASGPDLDLIEVKPRIKRTVWLHIYEHNIHALGDADQPFFYNDDGNLTPRIACIQVDIDCEHGQGLEDE